MSSIDIVSNGDFHFYVIDDLRKAAFPRHKFQSLNAALDKFDELSDDFRLTVLGVEKGTYVWELVQRVNGDNVLVQDYKDHDLAETDAMRPVLDSATAKLLDERVVGRTYSNAFFDRIGRSCPVIVPLGNDTSFDSNYCADKRLKTISGFGFDAINQLYVNGHGWVNYRDVCEDPESYAENGIISVEGVNVNYTLKMNLSGIDGQMDITPHDFAKLLQDINKEFMLKVYEARLDNSYIVESFEELKDAVRAWYELPVELTAFVEQRIGYSYHQPVFNGIDDDFNDISFEQASEIYGFEQNGVECLISDARGRVVQEAACKQSGIERETI